MRKDLFPPTIAVKEPSKNPINGRNVFEIVDPKILEPTQLFSLLKFKIKKIVKKTLRRGIITPHLFYDKEMHFAFFPRQNDECLSNFYKNQGENDSKKIDNRLDFFNSRALSNAGALMLDFAKLDHLDGIFCDFGAGSGWLAKAINDRTSAKVFTIDFSVDAMSHLARYDKKFELLTLDDFFSSSTPKYDFLGCVDTFEHLNDPLTTLLNLHEKANEGASVFLSVPNFDSYLSRRNFGIHPYYSFPSHLNYFTSSSFKALAESAGFKVLKQEVVTLQWEVEYLSRPYNKKIAPNSGWSLWDVMNNGKDGERLFMLLEKKS